MMDMLIDNARFTLPMPFLNTVTEDFAEILVAQRMQSVLIQVVTAGTTETISRYLAAVERPSEHHLRR